MLTTTGEMKDKPYFIPFKAEHMTAFSPDCRHTVLKPGTVAALYDVFGVGFTGMAGRTAFIAGGLVPHQHIGYGWLLTTPLVTRYPIWITRTVNTLLLSMMKGMELYYTDAYVDPGLDNHVRWASMLGFRRVASYPPWVLYRLYRRD